MFNTPFQYPLAENFQQAVVLKQYRALLLSYSHRSGVKIDFQKLAKGFCFGFSDLTALKIACKRNHKVFPLDIDRHCQEICSLPLPVLEVLSFSEQEIRDGFDYISRKPNWRSLTFEIGSTNRKFARALASANLNPEKYPNLDTDELRDKCLTEILDLRSRVLGFLHIVDTIQNEATRGISHEVRNLFAKVNFITDGLEKYPTLELVDQWTSVVTPLEQRNPASLSIAEFVDAVMELASKNPQCLMMLMNTGHVVLYEHQQDVLILHESNAPRLHYRCDNVSHATYGMKRAIMRSLCGDIEIPMTNDEYRYLGYVMLAIKPAVVAAEAEEKLALAEFKSEAGVLDQELRASLHKRQGNLMHLLHHHGGNRLDHHGGSILSMALRLNCVELARMMINYRIVGVATASVDQGDSQSFAIDLNKPCVYRESSGLCSFPIHIAAKLGIPVLMAEIVKRADINVKVQDGSGNTALHLAVEKRDWPALRLLLARDASSEFINIKNKQGLSVRAILRERLKPGVGLIESDRVMLEFITHAKNNEAGFNKAGEADRNLDAVIAKEAPDFFVPSHNAMLAVLVDPDRGSYEPSRSSVVFPSDLDEEAAPRQGPRTQPEPIPVPSVAASSVAASSDVDLAPPDPKIPTDGASLVR